MKSLAPGVVIGDRYILTRPLAKGGMGSVWVARHRELDVDVTVKFMMPTLVNSPELRGRFEREAKVAARLRSQHVVQVLDFGIDDEMPYIAMELLQGESLADRLKRESRIPLPVAARILTQICKALRTAHEAGLVHRDLKPGNVFLALKDGEEVVKVLDFGIVKDTAKSDVDEQVGATDTGVMMGSVHYMSPEQIRSSRQVDHRSDLWSVAVILYKMLTGNAPFPGTNQGDVMVRVCTDTCAPPSTVLPGLASTIDAFFVRALAREPAGRYQSAQEMADSFAAAANMDPTPFTAAQPAPKWVKTLPLLGGDPFVAAARAESAARHSIPSIPESSLLPASSLQTAPPTAFRPPIPSGVGALETKQDSEVRLNSSKTPLWILLGVVGVVLIGGMAILGQRLFAGTNETASNDEPPPNASASATVTTAAPIVQVIPSSVLSSASTEKSPEPKNPAPPAKTATNKATAPANEATAPTSTASAAPTTAPVSAPSPTPRKNPLDIND